MRESVFDFGLLQKRGAAVLGFGRAGRAVTDFLLSHGVIPTVYAQHAVAEELVAGYARNGVRFFDEFPETFPESVLFRSPGIRPDIPPVRRALAMGSVLSGETDLFMQGTAATVIGVTGSDGKTTTANLVAALLRAAGKHAVLGGNNGMPLLPHLHTLTAKDYAVIELSSFQLMTAPAPDVAVLTNLTPNHLNWHTDYTEYAASKCRALWGAKRLVTNAACAATREIGLRAPLRVTWFTASEALPEVLENEPLSVTVFGDTVNIRNENVCRSVPALQEFCLLGKHNRENLAAAIGAVAELVEDGAILQAVREFRGVPHRLQAVGTVRGVTYINSSIDTSPSRTAAALSALDERPIVIAGGRGKGIPLQPLGDALATHAKAVLLYGETAREIANAIGVRVPVQCCADFYEAFYRAADAASSGDTVLLSPGCTAFDAFRDFEERGEVFCRLVKELAEERK